MIKMGFLALLFGLFSFQDRALAKKNKVRERELSSPIILLSIRPTHSGHEDFNLCTGVFLDGQTILTAAHCRSSDHSKTKKKKSKETLYISAQTSLLSRDLEKRSFSTKEFSLHIHPEYKTIPIRNDLMIIKLKNLQFHFSFPAPVLTSREFLDWNRPYFFKGFGGRRHLSGRLYHQKRLVMLSLDEEEVQKLKDLPDPWPSRYRSRLYFKTIQEDEGMPVCKGDSGGPIYSQHHDGTLEVLAIASFMVIEDDNKNKQIEKRCATSKRSVHNWVYPHLGWITSFLNE
ncbi:MAG: trypsin-like serine protease [Bacteriovoracales bacterium]|nr:trypsin-like serine protease [Bacteriovoracales bacterium]